MADFHRIVPSLAGRKIKWSQLGEVTRPYEHDMPEDLPLCGRCLNQDVFPHGDMMIQTLSYEEDGREKTWDITVNDFCDDCSSDGRNAERRQRVLDEICRA